MNDVSRRNLAFDRSSNKNRNRTSNIAPARPVTRKSGDIGLRTNGLLRRRVRSSDCSVILDPSVPTTRLNCGRPPFVRPPAHAHSGRGKVSGKSDHLFAVSAISSDYICSAAERFHRPVDFTSNAAHRTHTAVSGLKPSRRVTYPRHPAHMIAYQRSRFS